MPPQRFDIRRATEDGLVVCGLGEEIQEGDVIGHQSIVSTN